MTWETSSSRTLRPHWVGYARISLMSTRSSNKCTMSSSRLKVTRASSTKNTFAMLKKSWKPIRGSWKRIGNGGRMSMLWPWWRRAWRSIWRCRRLLTKRPTVRATKSWMILTRTWWGSKVWRPLGRQLTTWLHAWSTLLKLKRPLSTYNQAS